MPRRMTRSLALLSLMALPLGCVVERGPFFDRERECAAVMFDSVGNAYPTEGECFPVGGPDSARGTDCTEGSKPGIVFVWGSSLFSACPSCDSGFGPTDCRPFVCETDDDCPYFYSGSDDEANLRVFNCEYGVCVDEDHPLIDDEDTIEHETAWALCMATVERGEPYDGPPPCPTDAERCETPLPDACWPL